MFSNFKYTSVPLASIVLDDRNPRLVTRKKLATQDEIIQYFFEHEDLGRFLRKICTEGKNKGAERPYVIGSSRKYTVIEGNTRIAAYKLLAGLSKAPKSFEGAVPTAPKGLIEDIENIEVSIAPNRDAMLPIMANAHFGTGDKSKWGYLGSRKAVHDEWTLGKSISQLSKVFGLPQGEINNLIIEYKLYLECLKFKWTNAERLKLEDPGVRFNPPVRFLETSGHKKRIGIQYDKANLKIVFDNDESKKMFKHMIKRLVVQPETGLGAVATFEGVFSDYTVSDSKTGSGPKGSETKGEQSADEDQAPTESNKKGASDSQKNASKPFQLFSYQPSLNNGLIRQLMKEARTIHCKKLPAAATFLLRNIVEAILKHIVDVQQANMKGSSLDLEACLNVCKGNSISLPVEDKKVLKEFQATHLRYLNLGAHGNLIPNFERVTAARDCIDQFVKKHS